MRARRRSATLRAILLASLGRPYPTPLASLGRPYPSSLATLEGGTHTHRQTLRFILTNLKNKRSIIFSSEARVLVLGGSVGMFVLSNKLNWDDSVIGMLSSVFDMTGSILMALAWSSWVLYLRKLHTTSKPIKMRLDKIVFGCYVGGNNIKL